MHVCVPSVICRPIQCFSCSGQASVNCTFVGSNSCGYTLVSSSSNLELSCQFDDPTSWCHAVYVIANLAEIDQRFA